MSPPPPPETIGALILSALAEIGVASASASTATAVTVAGTTITYAQIVGTTVLLATSAAIQMSMLPKPDPGQAQRNIRQAVPSRRRAVGRALLGGPLLFLETKDIYVHAIVGLTDGPVDAFEKFYLIDREVEIDGSNDVIYDNYNPRGTRLAKLYPQTGALAQTHHTALASALPTLWTSDHRLRGIANLYFRGSSTSARYTQSAWPSGLPEMRALGRWALCYDPRKDSTNGGTGSHRTNDPATWEWTDNSALIALFYLTLSDGYRLPWSRVNLASFIEAANRCDDLIPLKSGGTEKRYRCGGVFLYDEQPKAVLRRILATCDGADFLDDQGRVGIRVGVWAAPAVTLTADDIIGYEIIGGRGEIEIANVLRGKYSSPLHRYQLVEADPWINQESVDLFGEKSAEWDGSMVQSHGQMRRLLKRAALAAAPRDILKLTTTIAGEQAIGERFITVTFEDGGVEIDATFEVLKVECDVSSPIVTLELQSADSGHYAWDAANEEGDAPAVPPDSEASTAPVPVDLAATVVVKSLGGGLTAPVLSVSCDDPGRADATLVVEYKADGATDWQSITAPELVYTVETPILAVGLYDVRARFLILGAEQPASDIIENVSVTNAPSVPSSPVSFTAAEAAGVVTLTATSPNHANHRALRFWRNSVNTFGTATDLTGAIYTASNVETVRTNSPGAGTWYYWATSEFDPTARSTPAGPETITI